jgi:hypothetical protein
MTDWIKAEVDRRLRRDAHRDVTRIVELADGGYSSSVIASSVGLPAEFVREILIQADAARSEAAETAG